MGDAEMKLYEITNDIRELLAMADAGELSLSDIQDTMEALDLEFNEKAEAVIKVRQQMLADIAAIDKEIERLETLKSAPQKSAIRLEEYLKDMMLATEKDKLDLGLFKVTLRKASVVLGDIDEDKVPEQFWTEVPATRKLDKRSLLSAAKESEIEGVNLGESKRSLIIK